MELSPTQLASLQALTITSSKVRLENLSVGQELLAKVVAANSNGEVTLAINNALLNAKTNLPLSEGQLLQLLVAQTGKQIVLQLPEKLISQAVSQQLLREALPKQRSITETINQLSQVVQQRAKLQIPEKIIQITYG